MSNKCHSIFVTDPMLFMLEYDYFEAVSDQFLSLPHPFDIELSSFRFGYTQLGADLVYLCGCPYNFIALTPNTYPVPGNFDGTIILVNSSLELAVLGEYFKSKLHEYLRSKHYPVAIVAMPLPNNQKLVSSEMIRAFLEVDIPIFEIDKLNKDNSRSTLEQCYEYFQSHLDMKPNPAQDRFVNREKILSTNELYENSRNYHWIINITTRPRTDNRVFRALSEKVCWHLREDTKLLHWYGYRDLNENSRIYTTNVANFGYGGMKETVAGLFAKLQGETPPPPTRTHLQIADYIKQAGIIGYIGTFLSEQPYPDPHHTNHEIMRVRQMIEEFGDAPFVLIDVYSDSDTLEIRKRLNLADEVPLLAGIHEANIQQLYPLLEREIQRKQNK